ncbi:Protease Do-like 14-like protein [Heracleum sosnowskyi]|uniref:Protease Do-like 14-like protein n=1 Tax=Heracleum sosnowskyi TaxID=360622 RepID=A0AAD8MQF9_9APIA|nr:Protease Do-like 14-like protein [Heracleum sosnowskyi]
MDDAPGEEEEVKRKKIQVYYIMYGLRGERLNPWKRIKHSSSSSASDMRYIYQFSSKLPNFKKGNDDNKYLDESTKLAALKVHRSVVALECFCEVQDIIRGCGTIIETHHNKTIVLTSANLIRQPPCPPGYTVKDEVEENVLASNIKVFMHAYNGRSFPGEVHAYDFHFNLAILSFRTGNCYEPATLAHVNDSMDVFASQPWLRSHSESSQLTPGDRVIVVGRYFDPPFILMAAPGYYQLKRTKYDCKELFTTSCVITRCGDGAPLVNGRGEVIGISHYDIDSTQCIPINIARKWWEYYKQFGKFSRPSLGIEATNLYAKADLGLLENMILKFPDVSKGVIVEKVIPGSCADIAGMCFNDVIIQCAGKTIESFLKFFEIIMEHVGETVEIVVIRADCVTPRHLKLVVAEAEPDKFNSWPNRFYK